MKKESLVGQSAQTNDKLADFECKKTTQALNYLLRKSKNSSLNKVALVKLLWASDRYHLRNYGRLVAPEQYVAMKNGPVGSLAKDIIYGVTDYDHKEECKPYTSSFISKQGDIVSSLKETDTQYLSETDIEALDFAWEKLGTLDLDELVEFTHKYPEWNRHSDDIVSQKATVKEIDLQDFYKEPKHVDDDPFAVDNDVKSVSKNYFNETSKIRELLRH